MTIYEKPRSEVFASNAPESEISTFTAWLRGLGIAFDETNGLPEMKGLNNVFNLLNQYIKYLEQNGFAEWSPDLEYPIGAGVRVGAVWYRAKTQNTNKPPATSQNDWELFLNASALTYENPLYIENNVVKVRGATQTQSGVVQFANATEVANKANVNKVVNPFNVEQIASNSIVFLTGVASNGDRLPIPSGFTINQCSFFVSVRDTTLVNQGANNQGANFLRIECFVANGVLTSKISYYNNTVGGTYDKSIQSNYLIIARK